MCGRVEECDAVLFMMSSLDACYDAQQADSSTVKAPRRQIAREVDDG